MCAKSTKWEDMVQDDNRRVCGIPFSGNFHTASLSISNENFSFEYVHIAQDIP
jgi:hypothetical protein